MSTIDHAKGDAVLIEALVAGRSVNEAARTAGVSISTAHRRLRDPRFREQLTDARSAVLAAAAGRLADRLTQATETLVELLTVSSPMIRYLAARGIIELASKLHETQCLEDRITALEATVREQAARGLEAA